MNENKQCQASDTKEKHLSILNDDIITTNEWCKQFSTTLLNTVHYLSLIDRYNKVITWILINEQIHQVNIYCMMWDRFLRGVHQHWLQSDLGPHSKLWHLFHHRQMWLQDLWFQIDQLSQPKKTNVLIKNIVIISTPVKWMKKSHPRNKWGIYGKRSTHNKKNINCHNNLQGLSRSRSKWKKYTYF